MNNSVAFMTDSSTPADMNIADDLVIQQNQRASCISMEARKSGLLYKDKKIADFISDLEIMHGFTAGLYISQLCHYFFQNCNIICGFIFFVSHFVLQ